MENHKQYKTMQLFDTEVKYKLVKYHAPKK